MWEKLLKQPQNEEAISKFQTIIPNHKRLTELTMWNLNISTSKDIEKANRPKKKVGWTILKTCDIEISCESVRNKQSKRYEGMAHKKENARVLIFWELRFEQNIPSKLKLQCTIFSPIKLTDKSHDCILVGEGGRQ